MTMTAGAARARFSKTGGWRDWCYKASALDLAARLQNFWAASGGAVKVTIVCCGIPKNGEIYCVRSDMVNGLPAGRAVDLKGRDG
jgi:hypothetical protein